MHLCKVLCVLLILVAFLQYGEAKRKPGKKKPKHLRGVYVCKSQKACSTDKFCPKEYRYLPASQVCDGVGQCPCNDDEEMCGRCLSPDCPGMFQCKNSTCIDKNKVCDTEMDCGENEDEMNCTIQPPDCPDMFQCKNSTCIDKNKVCDTEMDCGENEDEMNCTIPPPDCPGMFQCKNSTCIDKAKVCDTEMNCGENEDEMECPDPCPRVCNYLELKCFGHFGEPVDINKPNVFIDVDGFELTQPEVVKCQAACNANMDCKTAIVEINVEINMIVAKCFLSTMTVTELEDNMNIVLTENVDCSSPQFLFFGVDQCL